MGLQPSDRDSSCADMASGAVTSEYAEWFDLLAIVMRQDVPEKVGDRVDAKVGRDVADPEGAVAGFVVGRAWSDGRHIFLLANAPAAVLGQQSCGIDIGVVVQAVEIAALHRSRVRVDPFGFTVGFQQLGNLPFLDQDEAKVDEGLGPVLDRGGPLREQHVSASSSLPNLPRTLVRLT